MEASHNVSHKRYMMLQVPSSSVRSTDMVFTSDQLQDSPRPSQDQIQGRASLDDIWRPTRPAMKPRWDQSRRQRHGSQWRWSQLAKAKTTSAW